VTEARKARVCILTSVHPPLDTRVFYRQARSTAAAGFDTLLVAPGARRGAIEGVRLEGLPARGGRAARPLRWPVLFVKAIRARADLYHFHDPELLPWGVLLKWVTRKPVIYDSHEYLKEDIQGKQWLPARLRRPVAFLADRVEKWCARRVSAVIAVTDDMAERFRRVQPNTAVVRNLPPAPDVPHPPGERLPHVAYAGLMNIERGLDILYETARLVRERVPGAEFHILGTIEWDGASPALRARTEAEWAAAGVRFLGTVAPGEVATMISGASVGWLPRSARFENNLLAWPNKLVEYMVVGLPVVASDLPLQARVVRENNCGRVVEALAPEAHASAIVELLLNAAEAERLGENGRRAALEKYTWEAEAGRLHTLYRCLLSPR
jgi:glycosyltransferase involved in cell wall biosynthesis